MTNKCVLCKKELKETFLGKMNGTTIKVKKGDKNELRYICSDCQKQHKTNLKSQIE